MGEKGRLVGCYCEDVEFLVGGETWVADLDVRSHDKPCGRLCLGRTSNSWSDDRRQVSGRARIGEAAVFPSPAAGLALGCRKLPLEETTVELPLEQ